MMRRGWEVGGGGGGDGEGGARWRVKAKAVCVAVIREKRVAQPGGARVGGGKES